MPSIGSRLLVASLALGTTLSLAGCTEPATPGDPSDSDATEPATTTAIEFAVASDPAFTIESVSTRPLPIDMTVAVVGDTVLVGGEYGSNVVAYDATSGQLAWRIEQYGGMVGPGSTRQLPLVTSAAAGGIVLMAYTEECYWEDAPCEGAPEGTESIMGVAAVAAADGSVVWRSELAVSGPPGSDTEGDGLVLEPLVVAADDDGVVVQLATHDGNPTPSGTPALTTFLLDAETGEQQWHLTDFRATALTAAGVFGLSGEPAEVASEHPTRLDSVVDRATGEALPSGMRGELWWLGGGSGGLMVEDRAISVNLETTQISVLGPTGESVASGADDQNLAQASCPERITGSLLACVVMARSHDTVLVTWAAGESAPTTAPAPLPGYQQLWAIAGEAMLISENGFLGVSDGEPTWFAARRDGTVASERYPGAAVAGSEDYVVVANLDDEGLEYLEVYPIADGL